MSDLYYHVSVGSGVHVEKDKIFDADYCLPDDRKSWHQREFQLFVFGSAIDPKNASSELFRCRELIATVNCWFIDLVRDMLPSKEMEDACLALESFVDGSESKGVIFVDNISVVKGNEDDIRLLISKLHDIADHEVKKNYTWVPKDEEVVVYLSHDEVPKGCGCVPLDKILGDNVIDTGTGYAIIA